jgi:hypothetical protein
MHGMTYEKLSPLENIKDTRHVRSKTTANESDRIVDHHRAALTPIFVGPTIGIPALRCRGTQRAARRWKSRA